MTVDRKPETTRVVRHSMGHSRAEGERRIDLAHEIATKLLDAGMQGGDGPHVMAMALGIYMASQDGVHRDFRPVVEVMLKSAQEVFDAFRRRHREAGHS